MRIFLAFNSKNKTFLPLPFHGNFQNFQTIHLKLLFFSVSPQKRISGPLQVLKPAEPMGSGR